MNQHLQTILTKAESGDLAACAELEAELMIDVHWCHLSVSCVDFYSTFSETAWYSAHTDKQSAKRYAALSIARQILESEE